MPFFSIVVPVYNTAAFLDDCLRSLQTQTFNDIEIIVVDDGSSDGSADILHAYEADDARIRVLTHKENQGLHQARKTGVMECRGDYVLFVDSDDELVATACEKIAQHLKSNPVDSLHFGLKVVAEDGVAEEEARALEVSGAPGIEPLEGEDILRVVFDESWGYKQDWRVWQRVFARHVAQEAFSRMVDGRINRAEDGYETFVLLSCCKTASSADDVQGHVYHYGRGITGAKMISIKDFEYFCDCFQNCFAATEKFVSDCPSESGQVCYEGLKRKDYDLIGNDWIFRIDDSLKKEAADILASRFGHCVAGYQVYRFVRDESYQLLKDEQYPSSTARLDTFMQLADKFYCNSTMDEEFERCRQMRDAAKNHLDELRAIVLKKNRERQSIRIFVSTHKDVDAPSCPIFQLVQVGAALHSWRLSDALADDEGENISDRNARYCELTTQYWAWKNVDAEYYGFCHYRRYFDFSSERHEENAFGEVMDDYIDHNAEICYCFDEQSIRDSVEGYDVVTTEFKDLRRFPGDFETPYEHYASAPFLHIDDLDCLRDIVCELYPDYAADVKTFLKGNRSCFCNMYILKKDIFFDYCAWLFPILEEFEARTDTSKYSKEALRTPGHLAERLFNIYYLHNKGLGVGWITNELQCIHFEHPERQAFLSRAFDGTAIPVVFAADDNYAPQLAVALRSVVENASEERYYDLVVLSRDMSSRNQQKIFQSITKGRPNVSLRFYDVTRMVKNYRLEANAHISTETYYRFLIQTILPSYEKVLYLDSDLVALADVADLYDMELGDNLLAAVRDADYLGNLNMSDGERFRYSIETLQMKDPYSYFQAGVLLLNTFEMRKLHSQNEWLELASIPYLYNDQDILNACCEGRVVYLDYSWNVMIDSGRLSQVIVYAPEQVMQAYCDSRAQPKIIHYAGAVKPWNDPVCDYAQVFWHYARSTPFYEKLISGLVATEIEVSLPRLMDESYVYVVNRHAARSWKRKIGDIVLPYGSRRRHWVRKMAGRA